MEAQASSSGKQKHGAMQASSSGKQKYVNILQLAQWLSIATASNGKFLLKPSDLRLLYVLVLWEYLSNHHPRGDSGEIPVIEEDSNISIPEDELVNIVKLVFNGNVYPCFNRIYNM